MNDLSLANLLRHNFRDRRDLSDPAVLADAAAGIGLERDRSAEVLCRPTFGELVRNAENSGSARHSRRAPQ